MIKAAGPEVHGVVVGEALALSLHGVKVGVSLGQSLGFQLRLLILLHLAESRLLAGRRVGLRANQKDRHELMTVILCILHLGQKDRPLIKRL